MIKDAEITETQAMPTMVYRSIMSPYDMKAELSVHLPFIYQTIMKEGKEVMGMPFTLYRETGDEKVDVEMGLPTLGEFELPEGYSFSNIPKKKIVKAKYFGPYGRLDEGYQELKKWAESQGHTVKYPYWEIYVSDPMEVEDLSKLQTDIHMVIE